MRRRTFFEPPSRLALWSRRLVLFALAVALIALLLVRGAVIEAVPGVVILGAAVAFGILGACFGVGALVVIWMNGNPGVGHAIVGLVGGLVLAAYPVFITVQGFARPILPDVTTDPGDPPRFTTLALLRVPGSNPLAYRADEYTARQRQAYPDIVTVMVEASPEQAYAAALAVATDRRWSIVEARAYIAGQRDGRIEAVARTPVMGFRDDVVIRVRAARGGTGAAVDIRSASRYGYHDLGANAQRVRSLMAEIEAVAQASMR